MTRGAAAKNTPKTEVATVSNNLPATMDASMLAADAGIGREQMSITDMALPYLQILQSLSPQVKKSSPQRVDGAEEGDIFNTVTQELFASEDGINVIPCAFQKAWVEWAPRDSGGGWIASHSNDQILNHCNRNEQGLDVRKDNGNIIVPTFYYYVLMLKDNGGFEPAIISMARTQMKIGRKWNSLMSSLQVMGPQGLFNPPMFAQKFHVTTEAVSNAKGEWCNWKLRADGLVDDAGLYQVAKKFAEQVRTGAIKASAPPTEGDDVDTHGDSGVF